MIKFLLFSSLIFLYSFQIFPIESRMTMNASIESNKNIIEDKVLSIDSIYIQKFNNKLLTAFYKSKDYKTVWLKSNVTRSFLLLQLTSCYDEGLNPKEYALNQLTNYEKKFEELSEKELVSYDVLLTIKLQKFISQLSNGRIDPKELYKDWDLKPNIIDINKSLYEFEKGDSLTQKIAQLKPNHIVYQRLKKALKYIDNLPEDETNCIENKSNKKISNSSMITIKKKLIYWKDLKSNALLNPIYNEETFQAIKKFQIRNGLIVDGVIGKSTIEALNNSKSRRREQIIANLDRWKWFPRDLGNHYIFINIPEFYLYVVKNNDTLESKKIVVGTQLRKTPILSSTFNSIILNPTWTVPPTILLEDVLPSATKRRSYFNSKNITIYDSKNKIIKPNQWIVSKYKNYRYVQSPGENNSLGVVKFNFPNKYSVYLHDTNHRDLFALSFRSLSSGCVRVENPIPLAFYLLNDKDNWSLEKINEVIKTKITTSINLNEQINIHQLYWTAGMNQDDTLQFYSDIYFMDDELCDKLSY